MNRKILVVAKEKHLWALQDIMEIARRLGCETRWLHEHERAPYGSLAFYTKAKKGKWARPARRKIMITKSFNECSFQQLVERVKNVIFPKTTSHPAASSVSGKQQSDAELEEMRLREIKNIRDKHSLLY